MRRAPLVLAAILLLLSAACVLAGLDRLPALTLDEAWTGLYATRLTEQGFYTPHAMNTYTGPLYGLVLSKALAAWSMSVRALRLPGALANAAAFLLAGWQLRRRTGDESAAWYGVLLASSVYLLLKSRLAWDVYALQPLLLAVTLTLLDRPSSRPRAFLFMAVTLVGVQNHFIYLSVPLSLVVLFACRAAWRGEEDLGADLRLALAALAAGAVVFLVKPRLSQEAWAFQRRWAVPLFLGLIPLATTAACGDWERPLVAALARPAARLWGRRLLGLGLFASLVWHVPPLWEALAGPVVWKRVFSWDAPWWLDLPLYLWSAFLLALVAWSAVRAWVREGLSPQERTLALWPIAHLAVFSLFRHTSSLRHYSIIHFLTILSLPSALSRLPKPDRRPATAMAAFALLCSQAVFWRNWASAMDRRPLQFHVGWRAENSWDFARKEALFAAYDSSGACDFIQGNSFTDLPLIFHRNSRQGRACDPRKLFTSDYCRGCGRPPFHRWGVVTR
ncbi:MAG TPA: hypothetical protein DCZ01_08910 [Elusimicrobia bacterium]|nr:MAG: hypothetical protein A2X37_02370 [Elusimicrobia bacterium GWA2_66_18]OGR76245.1 MAG: hypothetical protein A2X40_11720 [Elusimicrobia bacterium GWC2_65_9]HAZ08622.1 hypothetical protein [Elusimicrobiota bacterium]